MGSKEELALKIVTIGDPSVGKTRLLNRYTLDIFGEESPTNIGVEFKLKRFILDETPIKLFLWDTYGQERFRAITRTYFRGAHGIVIVYDITSQESFDNISEWMKEIDEGAPEKSAKILVGSKVDLHERQAISYSVAKEYADRLGIPVIETSAKTGFNVEKVFVTLVAQIKDQMEPDKPIHEILSNKPTDSNAGSSKWQCNLS